MLASISLLPVGLCRYHAGLLLSIENSSPEISKALLFCYDFIVAVISHSYIFDSRKLITLCIVQHLFK